MISESKYLGLFLTIAMLVMSNLFMTFAWYWHLRLQKPGAPHWPLIAIILVSWLIALVEYMIAVPANRLVVPFLMFFMGEKWRWDYLWALLCMVGAVYFVNRAKL